MTLMGKQIHAFEHIAYSLARQYGGNYIYKNNIKYTFTNWQDEMAIVPYNDEFIEVATKYKELKKDYDVLYAFISAALILITKDSLLASIDESFAIYSLLPNELQYMISTKETITYKNLETLRQEYRKTYFNLDIKRLIMKYKLFDL